MNELAIAVLAYNEAEVLGRCLESVQGLGELHVSIDTQSTDDSEGVARRYTEHVYRHLGLPEQHDPSDAAEAVKAHNSYSRMRNALLDGVEQRSRAKWIMWLDPDELLEAGGAQLGEILPQVPAEAAGLTVRMNLRDAGGNLSTVMRNTKIIARGVRFTRRRHEHITSAAPQVRADMVQIGHIPSQGAEVRRQHDTRKLSWGAFLADWEEFRDGRAAFYCADWWRCQGQAEEALRWYEAGLALPPEKCPVSQRAIMSCNAGKLYLERKQVEAARHSFWRTLEADWKFGEAYYYLGAMAANQRDWEQGAHWFGVALGYPDVPDSVMQQEYGCTSDLPYYGLACIACEQGDRSTAYHYLHLAEEKLGGQRPQYRELRERLDAQS